MKRVQNVTVFISCSFCRVWRWFTAHPSRGRRRGDSAHVQRGTARRHVFLPGSKTLRRRTGTPSLGPPESCDCKRRC